MWKYRLKKPAIPCLALLLLSLAVIGVLLAADNRDIPRMYIEGDLSRMKQKEDKFTFAFQYQQGGEVVSGYVRIKPQGHSSLAYEKKNFTVSFFQDEKRSEPMCLDLGWGLQNQYCLKANWIDKTHARNIVTARLIAQIQEKYGLFTQAPSGGTVDGFPVEVYSNGSFWGLYTLNIPKDAWLFGMDPTNPRHMALFSDDWSESNLFRGSPRPEDWTVEVGEASENPLEKVKPLFDFVMNSSDEAFCGGLNGYLDLDGVLNQYVMIDVAFLVDNISKNTFLVTYDGQKWYSSLYDLDTSWGASFDGTECYPYEEDLGMERNRLFERLEQCFPQELARRYFELREDILTKEHIMAQFEAFRDQIPGETFAKEAGKWGANSPGGSGLPGFEIDQIAEFLDRRIPVLDAKYEAMRAAGETVK